jgi:hypothetical protein
MPTRGDERDKDRNDEAFKLPDGEKEDYGPYGQQRAPKEDMSEAKKLAGEKHKKDAAEKARDQKNPGYRRGDDESR